MSRPREWAQLASVKRLGPPPIFEDDFDALDETGEGEEDQVDPYFGDAYHTMPGFGTKEKEE